MGADAQVADRLLSLWERPPTVWGWFATVDHKEIGLRYLVTAFIFLVVGGVEAILIRLQLARPDARLLTPEQYDQIFTMHGVTMIFWYASPILSGFANYLIPLFTGARDMAYPRLNAFTYWTFLASGLFLYSSALIGEAPHAGWRAWGVASSAPHAVHAEAGDRVEFMALSGLFISSAFTLGIIWGALPSLMLSACGRVR
jgi:cytochrome c oxidase subunit I+III